MSAADRFFVDTNVLLYSADASERQKRDAAHRWLEMLWASGTGRLSWQVLNEFTVNALRTLKAPQAKVRETVAVETPQCLATSRRVRALMPRCCRWERARAGWGVRRGPPA